MYLYKEEQYYFMYRRLIDHRSEPHGGPMGGPGAWGPMGGPGAWASRTHGPQGPGPQGPGAPWGIWGAGPPGGLGGVNSYTF